MDGRESEACVEAERMKIVGAVIDASALRYFVMFRDNLALARGKLYIRTSATQSRHSHIHPSMKRPFIAHLISNDNFLTSAKTIFTHSAGAHMYRLSWFRYKKRHDHTSSDYSETRSSPVTTNIGMILERHRTLIRTSILRRKRSVDRMASPDPG